jgi:hypothetical protein
LLLSVLVVIDWFGQNQLFAFSSCIHSNSCCLSLYRPDAVFPNNWISITDDARKIVLYPMMAPTRRLERRADVVRQLQSRFGFDNDVIDLSGYESQERFLEGTGSLVLDRAHKVAFMCISPRSDPTVFAEWGRHLPGYRLVQFRASSSHEPIYHTNVLMSIGATTAILCTEAISDAKERAEVLSVLREVCKKRVLEISMQQMGEFAGNALQLQSRDRSQRVWVMSARARRSLTEEQVRALTIDDQSVLLTPDLSVIENNGGGSARCMLCEILHN